MFMAVITAEISIENITMAMKPEFLFPQWGWYLLPLALFTGVAVWMAYRTRNRWVWFYLSFLLVKFIEKAIPGRIRHHHYQLLIPALCLGAAWGIGLIQEKYGKKTSWVLAGLVVLIMGLYEASWYARPALDWSRQNYGLDYVGVDQVVSEANRVLKPGETFYEWSEFPRFYYACDRRAPVGVLFGMHLFTNGDYGGGPMANQLTDKTFTANKFFFFFRRAPVGVLFGMHLFTNGDYGGGPMANQLTDKTIHRLQTNQPELVILDQQWRPEGWESHPVTSYIMGHYRSFSGYGINGRFEFLCRIGGALDQRLKAKMGSSPTGIIGNS